VASLTWTRVKDGRDEGRHTIMRAKGIKGLKTRARALTMDGYWASRTWEMEMKRRVKGNVGLLTGMAGGLNENTGSDGNRHNNLRGNAEMAKFVLRNCLKKQKGIKIRRWASRDAIIPKQSKHA